MSAEWTYEWIIIYWMSLWIFSMWMLSMWMLSLCMLSVWIIKSMNSDWAYTWIEFFTCLCWRYSRKGNTLVLPSFSLIRCVMKMDHHCPWINVCVGHHNHAAFTRFVFYTPLGCLHAALVNANFLYRLFTGVSCDGAALETGCYCTRHRMLLH